DYPASKLGSGAVGFWVLALEHAVLKGKARAAGHPPPVQQRRGARSARRQPTLAGGNGTLPRADRESVASASRGDHGGHRTCHGLAQVRRRASLMNPLTVGDLSE